MYKIANKIKKYGVAPLIRKVYNSPMLAFEKSGIGNFLMTKYGLAKKEISVHGVNVDVTNNILKSQIPRMINQRYEKEIITLIDEYEIYNEDIAELGGGIGVVSAYIDNNANRETNHIVLEPNKDAADILTRTRDINESSFEIVNKAYRYDGKDVRIDTNSDFTRASTYRRSKNGNYVPSTCLKQIVEKYGFSEFALVVDIEGAEANLIKNEIDLINNMCKYVVVEYHMFDDISKDVKESKIILDQSKNMSKLKVMGNETASKISQVIYKNTKK